MSKDILSKIGQSIRTGAETIIQGTKELSKQGLVKMEIMRLEGERRQKMADLGRDVYALHRTKTEFPAQLAEHFIAIDEIEKHIEAKNLELEALKEEAEAKEAVQAHESKEETPGYCAHCGAVISGSDAFCSKCGTKVG